MNPVEAVSRAREAAAMKRAEAEADAVQFTPLQFAEAVFEKMREKSRGDENAELAASFADCRPTAKGAMAEAIQNGLGLRVEWIERNIEVAAAGPTWQHLAAAGATQHNFYHRQIPGAYPTQQPAGHYTVVHALEVECPQDATIAEQNYLRQYVNIEINYADNRRAYFVPVAKAHVPNPFIIRTDAAAVGVKAPEGGPFIFAPKDRLMILPNEQNHFWRLQPKAGTLAAVVPGAVSRIVTVRALCSVWQTLNAR